MDMNEALTQLFYARDLTRQTQTWYRERVNRFIAWCAEQGVTDTNDLNKHLLRRYVSGMKDDISQYGKPLSSATRHGNANAVLIFANFCSAEGYADMNKIGKVELPKKDQNIIQPFTRTDIDRIMAACRNPRYPTYQARDKAIVTLLLDTGIRASELCTLTLDRCSFSPSDAYVIVNGKGRKQRQVYLGKDSRLALHRYIHEWRPETKRKEVFMTHINTAMTPEGLASLLNRLGQRARLAIHVNPHRFRHTFAYWYMATKQGDIVRLSRILGHSSVVVTENYLNAFGSQDAGGGSLLDTLRAMR